MTAPQDEPVVSSVANADGAAPPIVVLDTNRDALARRVDVVATVAGDRPVIATTSRAAVLMITEAGPPETAALIDLFATDHVSLDRPGERLIGRLRRLPETAHVRTVAWSAHAAQDVVEGVRIAGAHGHVLASLDRDAEREQLSRALAGEVVWPPQPAGAAERAAAFERWFEERYGLPWEPWIEPALVRLATTRERRAVAAELVARGAAPTPGQATRRMRLLADAIVGEHRNSPPAVAAAAVVALAQIAAHRPLLERPAPAISLEQGARAIRESPSLVRAAALSDDEIAEIVAIDELIRLQRLGEVVGAGAPPADQVRSERAWAAGRRAAASGASRDDIDAVIEGILVRLGAALAALDDARQDELYHPEGRAAGALALVGELGLTGIDGVDLTGDRPRWHGLAPAELALATDAELDALRAFTHAVDDAVRASGAWPPVGELDAR